MSKTAAALTHLGHRHQWSSDYPYQASSWPHSQAVVARDFKDASATDRFKITRGNVARLYGFDL